MGFWTEYFSTLFKGLRATSLKMRFQVRNTVNNLKRADHILYEQLAEDVEVSHRVTKVVGKVDKPESGEEGKLIHELKRSSDKAYGLVFNLSTEEITLLKTAEEILQELEAFSMSANTFAKSNPNAEFHLRKLERDFALAIAEAFRKGISEEREGYRYVELIINEAEEQDPKKFLAAVRLAFQKEKEQTALAKFAMRSEVRTIKVDILKLKQIPAKIKALRRRLTEKGKKIGVQSVINELAGTIEEIKKYCSNAFYEMYLLAKRDMIIELKVLFDLHNLREFNVKWARANLIPKSAALAKNNAIKQVQAQISKHFHTIAQAFRIIISKTQNLERRAEIDVDRLPKAA